jgi:thiosulfate reductase cytochrome b subunit
MLQDNEAIGRVPAGPLIRRQTIWTRLTHWLWTLCLFFLLLSGLQIFNAHPALYIGQESGFGYDNAVFTIDAVDTPEGPRGRVALLGHSFDTTGILGVSGSADAPQFRGFPPALTIPSYQDLATGRVVHFFFAWILVATLLVWLASGLIGGHIARDLLPTAKDVAGLPRDVAEHARLRFHRRARYNVLQKLSYATVLFVLIPLMIATGLAMSPGMDAVWPLLLDVFGGRQTARSIHFLIMTMLVLFFLVHILMVLAAGPVNELRSMTSGWYRIDPEPDATPESKP